MQCLRRAEERSHDNFMLTRDGRPLLNIRIAKTFTSRLRGLLGHCSPGPGEALLIKPCRSIHTFGMNYTIDVVFLDEAGRVLMQKTVKPFSSVICNEAVAVLEMAEGEAKRLHFSLGQILLVEGTKWY
jgi:uncharacterized membrane protein (UPF0127 family)